MEWSTACPDWEQRLIERRSIIPPPIYPDQAEQALQIFKQLRVTDLPGKPTFGECSEQRLFDFVAAIFGAYDTETGYQLIREFYLLISKKNTKSTIAAGIMLTAVILCWRQGEEHLILAPTKEVADNSFKPAATMVMADDELRDLFNVQAHVRTITHRVTQASLKVVAADTDTVSGKKSGRILIDEHWLFGTRASSEAMFMEATGGQVSRNEGWVIYLTTQSDEPPAGVFREKLQYYRDVRDGKIQDRKSLGVLYEFPTAMVANQDYLKPENFYITNPNIGRSVNADWLEDSLRKALAKGPKSESLQQFLAKHLNIEIGLNLRSDRWAGAEFWERQGRPEVTLETLIERSEVVVVGIDGGGLDDLLGLAVLGREAETGKWILWCRAWAHQSVLARRRGEEALIRDLAGEGSLILCERFGQDLEELADIVQRCWDVGLLDQVGVDQSGLGSIIDAITARGVPIESIVGIPQGFRLVSAIKAAERKLSEEALIHEGSRLMNWCVGNAKVVASGNAYLITKQASGSGKIDPLMATFDAIELMSRNPQGQRSFWDTDQ